MIRKVRGGACKGWVIREVRGGACKGWVIIGIVSII